MLSIILMSFSSGSAITVEPSSLTSYLIGDTYWYSFLSFILEWRLWEDTRKYTSSITLVKMRLVSSWYLASYQLIIVFATIILVASQDSLLEYNRLISIAFRSFNSSPYTTSLFFVLSLLNSFFRLLIFSLSSEITDRLLLPSYCSVLETFGYSMSSSRVTLRVGKASSYSILNLFSGGDFLRSTLLFEVNYSEDTIQMPSAKDDYLGDLFLFISVWDLPREWFDLLYLLDPLSLMFYQFRGTTLQQCLELFGDVVKGA